MIEIGYDFNIKDINKIKKYKNPTLDIFKNELNDNSKYKIFLNKTQFNNLLKNKSIKYRLTDSKKMIGDGIGSLLSMALNMIKPALPKIASTIGLSELSAGVSHGINKALNKIILLNYQINKLMI